MSSNMSGPLSDKPDGITPKAQVNNTCLPAGKRPNKTSIFISGVRDTRAFLAWLRASSPGGLTAQHKADKLMVVPSNTNSFRAAVSALRSLDGGGCEFPQLHVPGGPLCATSGEETGPRASFGRSWSPWAFTSRGSRSYVPTVVTRAPQRTTLAPPLHCFSGARA